MKNYRTSWTPAQITPKTFNLDMAPLRTPEQVRAAREETKRWAENHRLNSGKALNGAINLYKY